MLNKIYRGEKPSINIATIGHIDHDSFSRYVDSDGWESMLSAAIINYLPEEAVEMREVRPAVTNGSIAPVFYYETENRHYAQFSCRRDQDLYLETFLGLEFVVDGAILFVTSSEGVTSEIRQHVYSVQRSEVPKLVVFINTTGSVDDFFHKTESVDDTEHIDLVEREIRALLDQYHFDGEQTPIIKGSAGKAIKGEAEGIEAIAALMDAVDRYIPTPLNRVSILEKPFLMPVEDVFSITGRGTAAFGRIERGVINTGDPVEIIDMTKEGEKPLTAVVQGIELFRRSYDRGEAGDNQALFLNDIDKEDIRPGMVIYKPGSLDLHKVFKCEFYYYPLHEYYRANEDRYEDPYEARRPRQIPFFSGYSPQFDFRSILFTGQIILPPEVEMVQAGDLVSFEVTLDKAIPMEIGLRFGILEDDCGIGFGKITEILK